MEDLGKYVIATFGSIGAVYAAVISALPGLTLVVVFLWWCVRLYETETVQRWLRGR